MNELQRHWWNLKVWFFDYGWIVFVGGLVGGLISLFVGLALCLVT